MPPPAAPPPPNEAERQRALESYQVLDVKADPVFETITRLTAEICGVPISLLSLIDRDRQWFFARCGIDLEATPRSHALCAHAILQDSLMEIPDASTDERFADSPLVTGYPGIRFYAAQPLATSEGLNLGTACVAAPETRKLESFQRAALKEVASMVTMLLESRKAVFEQEQQLRHMATHDELTALPNRALGMDRLETAIARARRNGTKVALLFIDLDHFKVVNDTYGHAAGDEVLSEIGRRLVQSTRETDTVTRWGGDEFIVILSDIRNVEDAEFKQVHLMKQLAEPCRIADKTLHVSASIGTAFYPDDGTDEQALLHHADAAMYQQKRARDEK